MSTRRTFSLWGPVLLEAALLFYLSSLRVVLPEPRGWDKVAHFLAYALFGLLLTRALHGGAMVLGEVFHLQELELGQQAGQRIVERVLQRLFER